MKYFLCTFDTVYMGISAERTERIISVSRKQSVVCENETQETFISLPLLFGRADLPAPHGIVLKRADKEKQTTLLVPSLDIDLEIPEKEIYAIPRAFGGNLRYFGGACFINRGNRERLIFTLDLEKLLKDFF